MREVDMEDPSAWTEAEILYLRDRNQLPADFDADKALKKFSKKAKVDEETTDEDLAYEDMSKKALKALATERGLDVTGDMKKDELIASLEADDADTDDTAE